MTRDRNFDARARSRGRVACAVLLGALLAATVQAQQAGTAFTYQGRLLDAGQARTGTIDLRFDVFAAANGGDALNFEAPLIVDGVPLVAGVFTVQVDFGALTADIFNGGEAFVQIGVREDADGSAAEADGFTALEPRQAVTLVPYAQFARRVADGAIEGQQIADGTISFSDLQPGAVNALVSNTTDLRFGLQRRVVGECPGERSAIRAVAEDGSISCAYFDPPAPIAPVVLDADGDVGEHVSVAVAGDRAAIAYYDRTAARLKFLSCTVAACPASGPVVVDDPLAGDAGLFASVALDTAGLPRIAYYDASSGDLRLALCSDSDCAGPITLRTLDSAGDVGRHASIAIGSANRVAIAYYDATGDTYKMALCASSACNTHTVATLPGFSGGGIGASAVALQIGGGGSPRIALLDGGSILKLVRCSAPCDTTDTIATLTTDISRPPLTLLRARGELFNSNLPLWVGYADEFGRARFVQCDDDDCGGEPSILAPNGATLAVGGALGLSQKPEGTPLVVATSSGGEVQSIDFISRATTRSPNSVGAAASVFADVAHFAGGDAVIVYHDEPSGELRYQRCARADCSDQ